MNDSPTKPGSADARQQLTTGFTLVEVMLSLALCIVIMGLLAAASQMYMMNIQVEREELTKSRAARAVLQVMAFDLRAAVQYKPVDETALDESIAVAEEALAALGGEEAETEQESGEEEQVVEQPGLAGGPNSISFDISRLPRRDQFAPVVDGKTGRVVSIPSEILNIQYMVGTVQEDNKSGNETEPESGPRIGLLRMEFDRAAKRFADGGGGSVAGFEMMADEVKGLGFRYFDGAQWYSDWDSNQKRTLPVAVEITLQVDPRTADVVQQQARTGDIEAAYAMQEYVVVVHLPVAESAASIQAREELKNYVE
jgi:type II secretory pathway pseudopilin PulG